MAGPILSWQQPVEKQIHQLDGISLTSKDREGAHTYTESAGLRRARQAAEQARAVAAAVAIATAAAADRATLDQAFHSTPFDGAAADDGASSIPGEGGGESWRGAAHRLTERALLLHERGAAADTHRDLTAAQGPQRRGSRFVPDALPFHCAADYLSHGGCFSAGLHTRPSSVAAPII